MPGRPSRSPPTAGTSARSTCSSRPPGGLFLVEIKSHPGTATNRGSTWLFRDGDKTRTIENPLHFTDQKALALIELSDRSGTDGWPTDRLTPLLAGLLEVMPWVRQWHNETDPTFGQSPAGAYDTYLTSERESWNLTEEALRTWRPPQVQRGRCSAR